MATMRFGTWRRLWVSLARAQHALGLPVTQAQVDELAANVSPINYDVVAEKEKELRHDVMAHIYGFGVMAPGAKGVIHLGATSCYVTDNADLIIFRDALQYLRGQLLAVMVFGAVVGTLLDLDGLISRLGGAVERRFSREGGHVSLAEGFVTASLLFCVGAMTIVGSLNAGLRGDNEMLYTKSLLDLISSCMAGADSEAVWILAPLICGRQVSYQMVPICEVQVPPARSEMPLAEANLLFLRVRQTIEA